MKRWFPHPLMAATLAIVWLLLTNSVSPANLLGAVLFGAIITRMTSPFWPARPRLPRPRLLLRYLGRLLVDIVRANLKVTRLILGPMSHLRPGFIELPLELEDEFAITLLANTISLAPGTVSVDLTPDRRTLVVHALDVPNREALVRTIKERYERHLKEMFE